MKPNRIALITVAVFLCLQFTCGHSNRSASLPAHTNLVQVDMSEAAMVREQKEFWRLSARIDSLLKKPRAQKRIIEPMRSTDPIYYE